MWASFDARARRRATRTTWSLSSKRRTARVSGYVPDAGRAVTPPAAAAAVLEAASPCHDCGTATEDARKTTTVVEGEALPLEGRGRGRADRARLDPLTNETRKSIRALLIRRARVSTWSPATRVSRGLTRPTTRTRSRCHDLFRHGAPSSASIASLSGETRRTFDAARTSHRRTCLRHGRARSSSSSALGTEVDMCSIQPV